MAAQRQEPRSVPLCLPDMHHLVDEMALKAERGGGKIVAIVGRLWVEVEMPARRHRHPAWLEGYEFAAPDLHRAVVDRIAEDAARQRHLARGQRARAADRAGRRRAAQRASPAARSGAAKLCVVPSAKRSVTITLAPGFQSGAGCIAMT